MFRKIKKQTALILALLFLLSIFAPAAVLAEDNGLPPELDNMIIVGCVGISIELLFEDPDTAREKINDALGEQEGVTLDDVLINFTRATPPQFFWLVTREAPTADEIDAILDCLTGYWDEDGNWVAWAPQETTITAPDPFGTDDELEVFLVVDEERTEGDYLLLLDDGMFQNIPLVEGANTFDWDDLNLDYETTYTATVKDTVGDEEVATATFTTVDAPPTQSVLNETQDEWYDGDMALQEALWDANFGDSLLVYPGEYVGVEVDTDVFEVHMPVDNLTIRADGSKAETVVLHRLVAHGIDTVHIEGLTFKDGIDMGHVGSGIGPVVITNNVVESEDGIGIYFHNLYNADVQITDNEINAQLAGIATEHGAARSDLVIAGNQFAGTGEVPEATVHSVPTEGGSEGAKLQGSEEPGMQGGGDCGQGCGESDGSGGYELSSEVDLMQTGFIGIVIVGHVHNSSILVEDNDFEDLVVGILTAAGVDDSDFTVADNNIEVTDIAVYFIENFHNSQLAITGNEAKSDELGILLDGEMHQTAIDIVDNTVEADNDQGIALWGAVYDSQLNILDNTVAAGYHGIVADNLNGTSPAVDGNTVTNEGGHGIRVRTGYETSVEAIAITNNSVTGAEDYGPGIRVQARGESVVNSVTVTGNDVADTGGLGIQVQVSTRCVDYPETGSHIKAVTVSENTVTNSGGMGIRVHSGVCTQGIDSVVVTGNTVTDAGCHGIRVQIHDASEGSLEGVTVTDNTVENSGSTGIRVGAHTLDGQEPTEMDAVTIENNTVTGSGSDGIRVHAGRESVINTVAISGNTVTDSDCKGIRVHAGHQSSIGTVTVNGNTVTDNVCQGIRVSAGYEASIEAATIRYNEVSGHERGIWVFSCEAATIDAVTIRENDVSDNDHGIYLERKESHWYNSAEPAGYLKDVVVRYNTISGNEYGIFVLVDFGSIDGLTIRQNEITGNDWGLYFDKDIDAEITNALIQYNNFEENVEFALQNDTGEAIDATNNWWNDSRGPYHETNVFTDGDRVSDDVLFDPWATSRFVF